MVKKKTTPYVCTHRRTRIEVNLLFVVSGENIRGERKLVGTYPLLFFNTRISLRFIKVVLQGSRSIRSIKKSWKDLSEQTNPLHIITYMNIDIHSINHFFPFHVFLILLTNITLKQTYSSTFAIFLWINLEFFSFQHLAHSPRWELQSVRCSAVKWRSC